MEKIKSNRVASFLVLALIYIFATGFGVGVYIVLPLHFALRLLIADVAATVFVFIFSLIFKNASVYDPYWSVQPPVILVAFSLYYGLNSLGALLCAAVLFWSIRLTANWAYTFKGLSHQDWRYTMLSEKTGKAYTVINFVGIHLIPTLVVYGCTLPSVFAIVYAWDVNFYSVIFVVLAFLAAILQAVSDIQMHRYRKSKSTPFIREGLWKYSRHPNYLGEILMWWSIALAVASAAHSLPILIGAFANTLLFLFVSVPLADGRQSKKDGWESYKNETRMLLPIYKKH